MERRGFLQAMLGLVLAPALPPLPKRVSPGIVIPADLLADQSFDLHQLIAEQYTLRLQQAVAAWEEEFLMRGTGAAPPKGVIYAQASIPCGDAGSGSGPSFCPAPVADEDQAHCAAAPLDAGPAGRPAVADV